ncbi:hydroxyisourate hydrolase [Crateriforma conspicua]|uniref:Carboxypeptidase regulatory-like domain-containing protein n=1 Tax=Crateriforma conspicua TaxID=2527996 RepID=A0A5C6FZE2_9PLAN|nr:hydroxyisourate hydrolase [Crateriforma conspicua]TWU66738.1 hypothetical protein V7x_23090 [Crateriforma conspicua]
MVSRRIIPPIVIGLLVIATPGCESQPTGLTAAGEVTAKGKPVSGVVITLQPVPPTQGPKATALVFDGRFEFGPDAGLTAGQYRVRFSLLPPEFRQAAPEEQRSKFPPVGSVIPAKFDSQSNEIWELKSDQENRSQYEITIR